LHDAASSIVKVLQDDDGIVNADRSTIRGGNLGQRQRRSAQDRAAACNPDVPKMANIAGHRVEKNRPSRKIGLTPTSDARNFDPLFVAIGRHPSTAMPHPVELLHASRPQGTATKRP
jgi:hypothetical protein